MTRQTIDRAVFTVLLFLLLGGAKSFAATVSGRLVDDDGAPVEFAEIVAKTADGAILNGTISSEKGEFCLEIGEGRVTLVASCIGYLTLTVSCSADDLGDLTMPKDAEMLAGAAVQASRTTQKGGQFIVIPDPKDVERSAQNFDYLNTLQLPGLMVNKISKEIKVNGGDPVLMVNGKKVINLKFETINPKSIKRVEYSNAPGARHLDSDATGVVNIILKEADDGGSVMFRAGQDIKFKNIMDVLMLSHHKGKNEFSLGAGFSRSNFPNSITITNDSFISPSRTIDRKQEINVPEKNNTFNLLLDYTHQANDSTMFVASLLLMPYKSGCESTGQTTTVDRGISRNDNVILSENNLSLPIKLDLFYSHKLPNKQAIEFNVVGEYNKSSSLKAITYPGGSGETYTTDISNQGWALSAEAVYCKAFKRINTRYGVQYHHDNASNDYKVGGYHSQMTKDNTYIYAQAQGAIAKNLSWDIGTGAKILSVNNGEASSIYLRNLSTAMLSWRINDCWSLTYNAKYTPKLPSLSNLTPVFQQTDFAEAIQGNPDLKPSQNLENRLMLRYVSAKGWYFNITGGYDFDFGCIYSDCRYDPAKDLFVTTPVNLDRFTNRFIQLETGVKDLFGHVSADIYTRYYQMSVKGEGIDCSIDKLALNGKITAYWGNFSTGIIYTILPEYFYTRDYIHNIEIEKDIFISYDWKHLSASISWCCPFQPEGLTHHKIFISNTHPGESKYNRPDCGNQISFELLWNFNFGKSFRKGYKTLQNGGYDSGMVR